MQNVTPFLRYKYCFLIYLYIHEIEYTPYIKHLKGVQLDIQLEF